jgi:hypothetical protein
LEEIKIGQTEIRKRVTETLSGRKPDNLDSNLNTRKHDE